MYTYTYPHTVTCSHPHTVSSSHPHISHTHTHAVVRHQVPINQMGNYQEHLKRINPLRELDSGAVRTQLFGNPFKLERPTDNKVGCMHTHTYTHIFFLFLNPFFLFHCRKWTMIWISLLMNTWLK